MNKFRKSKEREDAMANKVFLTAEEVREKFELELVLFSYFSQIIIENL